MSKKFDMDLVRGTTVDSDDNEATEIRGCWYKNQRYFSHSIFSITVEGTVATIGYFKGDIDFKGAGKAYWSYSNSGDKGDLVCPTIHKIGNTPVLVVAEIWKDDGGYNSRPYNELILYSYNGGYAQFDGVYTVKGQTFLLNKMLSELGFGGERTPEGYVHNRPTPEEAEVMSAKEAEERNLYRLQKKKEAAERKAAAFEGYKQLHADGKLVLAAQIGIGYSPYTGIKLPKAPEGTTYVFAWFEEGKAKEMNHVHHRLTKTHLKEIGIVPVKSVNRWYMWFHAVANEDLAKIPTKKLDYKEYCMAWR